MERINLGHLVNDRLLLGGQPYHLRSVALGAASGKRTANIGRQRTVLDRTHGRGAFVKEWLDRGYETPDGGWGAYDTHII